MTALTVVLLCLAGGAGAAARFVLDGVIRQRLGDALPWATFGINLTGSLLLGLLAGFTSAHLLSPPTQLVVGTGLLGGYTTFSTATVETIRLWEERHWHAAVRYALGSLIAGTAAAGLGWVAGLGLGSLA